MADVRNVNLNRLAIFVAVIDAGSLSAAAARLGLAKTMVSTHMQRLEAEVGASLLVRTTRRLGVTEAGRALYDASVKILSTAEEALNALGGGTAPLRGTLRVSAPNDYGARVVAPALVDLRRLHPQLEVELLISDRYVDLIADGIDVAIRLGRLADSNYRAVKLGSFVKWLVASPGFVHSARLPRTVDELAALPYCALSVLPKPLTLDLRHVNGDTASVRCAAALLVNTADACRAATLAGGGIGLLTDFSIAEDVAAGRLIRLLPDWSTAPASIQAVFPPTSHPPAKVRALIDALKRRLAADASVASVASID
ncbi:LysR family transcriptional regulator [Paraburkholderia sp. MMS20-SJTR3]|uniref:LysR family transcriptional regulator n=1 Tax=Paraburkholderia sejongensis TaxID=2886946 RepID=A0ABS8K413_9BURK|nr:LysR family transcriptional regulator [Paraburkholderia sp. MMS20-SJTR3]MCC8396908.1 LysR family transcriptional regulator [Paraburkholderia sp. MMS20-SJTR3]